MWVTAAVAVAAAGVMQAYSPQLRQQFDYFRHVWTSAGTGATPPPVPVMPVGFTATTDLLGLLSLGAQVVFLVWLYRAATAARWLGYPARRSPGWGVAGWFIPVVNLWFPYQAIRDTLPPGHPARPAVLRYWLSLLVALIVGLALEPTIAYSRTAGGVLEAVSAVAWVVAATTMWSLIPRITAAHREAVETAGAAGTP